ncbi:unnamed protein product [Dracunculus medinensis]|uniref:Squamous cell carcinoma antigen recognized by T-cells 3 n=1 Tax=Dracunculus medinensis TaxID=318479 RepID=A0A0N4U2U0_DRAME|nr:unnamed protein product [Dracunculus medinensis]
MNNDSDTAEQMDEVNNNEMNDEDDSIDEISDEDLRRMKDNVETNPEDYELRLKFISILRAAGELDDLREQRKSISEKFTMAPAFWLEWISDEFTCESNDDFMIKLFERAVKDFHCPNLYVEFVKFACGVSINYAREKMEEMVNIIGLRYDCGSLIWNIYLDFEKTILQSLSEGSISESVKNNYDLALKRMQEITDFEHKYANTETVDEKIKLLLDHIANLTQIKRSDPAEIQMLYERALTESASESNFNLWLQYGWWLDYKLKIRSVALNVYERAIRHSPCAALWQQYLTALERANTKTNIIDSKWPIACETISTAEEGTSLYRTYIYLLRRRAVLQGGNYSNVLKIFAEGASFLRSKFGQQWDLPNANYRKNHAYFLYATVKDPEKARIIWNDILSSGFGYLAAVWLEAIRLERVFGDVAFARKLFYKAINSVNDHPYQVFEAMLQFEREEGSLEELDLAVDKVDAQIARISSRPFKKGRDESSDNLRQKRKSHAANDLIQHKRMRTDLQNDSQMAMQAATKKEEKISSNMEDKKKILDKDGFAVPTLPLFINGKDKQELHSSEQSGSDIAQSSSEEKSTYTVFISNLDFKIEKEKIQEIFPTACEVRFAYRGASKIHKGFGYVEFKSEEEAVDALTKDRSLINGRPMYVSEYKPNEKGRQSQFRYPTGLEKNKVFVSNVHYEATQEQIKQCFSKFGPILDVRIVVHKSGKPKGCAYVEFESEEHANEAVKDNGLILLERKLSVALSNPPRKENPGQKSTAHQRSRIDLIPRAVSRSSSNIDLSSSKGMSNSQFRSFLDN